MGRYPPSVPLLWLLLWMAACCVDAGGEPTPMVVDLGWRAASVPLPTKIAAQACVGLINRAAEAEDGRAIAPAYALWEQRDVDLLLELGGLPSLPALTAIPVLLARCAGRRVRYNASAQQRLIPNILTVAAVLDAVPMEDGLAATVAPNATVVFDATQQFRGMTALQATADVYGRFAANTTALAMINPGLDVHGKHHLDPPLTGEPNPRLFDYVSKRRLFAFFLNDACIPLTSEHSLMERMVAEDGLDPWPRPVPVYGYNDAWSVAGDLFEANTNCVKEHNLGTIASNGVPNLSFFSSAQPAVTSPLVQLPPPRHPPFNSSQSYVGLVVGDGDNIAFLTGSRHDWMQRRVEHCRRGRCFPLLWTISPHLLRLAPGLARWYFESARLTGADRFVLPPSGDLYSYPAMMDEESQAAFVANTERDCVLLNTSATVDWEWAGTWAKALHTYLPRFAPRRRLRGAFTVNVPFNMPVLEFGHDEFFKVVGGNEGVVVFRPREWRGSQRSSIPFSEKSYLTPAAMASELNANPKGTASAIYLTSDGGGTLEHFYNMSLLLDEHVKIVDADTLVDMALAAHARDRGVAVLAP